MEGSEVRLAGWVHEVRNIGKIIFLILRDHSGLVQVIAKEGATPDAVMKAMNLPKESVVSVSGTIRSNAQARRGFEIAISGITDINPLSAPIPFEVTGKVPAELDVRLNYRYIDFRRAETTAIFSIQAAVLREFRDAVYKEGFQEIRPPEVVEAATEGGADLFQINYFERKAYMAQSPQLYKQLAVIGGMDRVSMVVPVFRAEKHNTVYHLNESTQMDIEMGFAGHEDVMAVLKRVFYAIQKGIEKNNARELAALGVQLNRARIKEITYKQAVAKLSAQGAKIEFGQDFNREDEERLRGIYGDAILVKEYPTALRAFYSMPNPGNPEVSNSFDLIYKGLEICSGAQRIHDPGMLTEAIRRRGMNPKDFEFYINSFRMGAPPHAGWSIGLERLTMKLTGMGNIRECALFPRDRERLVP
ncbi:MAG: aspartate--tRNA(Asn) ligase [Candidatus Marsarchaeota archaeon]|jgi:aspartyl-tRNA synthetase|nr:aspartate--tRNA(Asn) ligase [Candidatus Marsarchaeota archaeon]